MKAGVLKAKDEVSSVRRLRGGGGLPTLKSLEAMYKGNTKSDFPAFSKESQILTKLQVRIPAAVDWRKAGIITPIQQTTPVDCWIVSGLENLKWVGMFNGKRLVLDRNVLAIADFRNDENYGARDMAHMLQSCMKMGIYEPRLEGDPHDWMGPLVPLGGYIRVPPIEEVVLWACTQQPLLASIHQTKEYINWSGGSEVFYPTENAHGTYKNDHVVNIVAFDDSSFTILDPWGPSVGDKGFLRLPRGSESLFGPLGLFKEVFLPFLAGSENETELNSLLLTGSMGFQHLDLLCYCPRNFIATMKNPHCSPENISQGFLDLPLSYVKYNYFFPLFSKKSVLDVEKDPEVLFAKVESMLSKIGKKQ